MSRNFVAIIEKLLQSLLNEAGSDHATQKTEWRYIVYFIAQHCSIWIRLNDVPVAPFSKRSFDLHILKHVRRIINGVLRNPPYGDRTKNSQLDHCLRAEF